MASTIANEVALYPKLIGARIRSQLQYRASFVMYALGAFILTVTDFVAIWVVFQHVPALEGWSFAEIGFFYGTSYVSFKVTDMILGHLDLLPEMIRTGQFDTLLVRPLGSLYQLITSDFALRHIGGIFQAMVIFTWAITRLEIDWDPSRVGMLLLMLVCGGIIFGSIWIIGASTVFWTLGSGLEVLNAFTYGGNQLTSYPLNIYSGWMRRILAFVIPLGFVNYFPALYILGKDDPLGSPDALRFMSPVAALIVALAARFAWRMGVRHYRSTGN